MKNIKLTFIIALSFLALCHFFIFTTAAFAQVNVTNYYVSGGKMFINPGVVTFAGYYPDPLTGVTVTFSGPSGSYSVAAHCPHGPAGAYSGSLGPVAPGENYYISASWGGGNGPFTVGSPDSQKPYYPYMNSGSFTVYDRNVDIYMSCHDNVAITGYCLKEAASLPAKPGITDPAWVAVSPVTPLSTNVLFALSPAAGFKNVYVWFRDAAGNISDNPDANGTPSRTFQLILDTGPPTGLTISATTPVTSRKTDISLTATDDIGVTAYKIDEPPFYSSGWVAVTAAKNFSKTVYNVPLSKNPGDKTIKAWVKDDVGNVSAAAQTVVRFNDTSIPTGSFTIPQPAGSENGYLNSPAVNMTLTANDIESDVTHYYIREEDGGVPASGDTGWRSFPAPLQQSYSSFSATYTIGKGDGPKSVYVWFKDAANNVGTASGSPQTINIDTQSPLAGNAESARWMTVGPEVISANWAHHESVFVYNGIAYCAFIDYSKSWKISIKKFDGTSWVAACPPAGGGSAGGPYPSYSKGLSLFVYNNVPYVAYSNYGDSYRGFVLNSGGNAWSVVGGARFSSGAIAHPNINFIDGRLYVTFRDDAQNGKATVVYHDSVAGWVTVGSPGFTPEASDHPQIYKLNDKLRVDYQPQSAMDTVKTMQFDNGSWAAADNDYPSSWIYRASPDPVNGSANGSARFVFNSVPYVILMDPLISNYGGKATVKKFDGSSWVTVGDPGFSNGDAFYPAIGVFNGVPYAAYEAGGPGWRASVAKYEAVTKNGIIINDGAKLTTVRNLKIKIFGTDNRNITPDYPSGVAGYCIKCNNSTTPLSGDPVWLAMPATYSNGSPTTQEIDFTLPANEPDGLKIFYLWFKDKAGNVSSVAQKSIKFDTHPPVEAIAGNISIAGPHPELIITREVMLQLNAESGQDTIENEGYYDIKVSHYFLADCNLGTTVTPPTASSAWKPVSTPVTPYSDIVSYTVTSSGDGTKEIYVWYKDVVGNTSLPSKCVTFLDTSVPHGSFTINSGAQWSNSPLVTLNLNALSATAVSGYFISMNSAAPAANDAGWHPVSPPVSTYTANVPYSLDRSSGVKTVYVWYKSTSNIVSTVSSDTIKLDCEAPVPGFGKMKKLTIAGSGEPGDSDGPALSAKFNYPTGIAFDSKGNLYIADDNNHKIRKLETSGNVVTFAGPPPGDTSEGSLDGASQYARFNCPTDVKIDAGDNIYIGAYRNTKVRKILPNGYVTTFAGSDTYGIDNGPLSTATFTYTFSTVFDKNGNMYVSDHGSWKVRKISASGYVTTLAGSGAVGDADGTGTGAVLHNNNFINVDSTGNVYISLGMPHYKIRKITPSGVSTVFAGPPSGVEGNGSTDGYRTDARFAWPGQMIFDNAGNMYVADASNGIRKISTSGMVSTYYKDSGFYTYCITFGKDGYIYTSDQYANKIYKLVPDTSNGLEINNGAQFVYTTAVKLNLAATDDYAGITDYYASESPAQPNASTTWLSLTMPAGGTAEVNFTLSTVAEPVTVYVWFRDAAGNISPYSKKKINPRTMRIESALGDSSIFSRPFLIARDSDENLIVGDTPSAGHTPVFKMNAPLYSTGARILTPGAAIDAVMDGLSALVAFADNHLGLIETAKKRFAVFNGAGNFVNGFAKSVDMLSNYHGYQALADIRGRILDKYDSAGSVRPHAEARAAANQTTGVPLDLNFAPAKLEVFADAACSTPAGEKVSPSAALHLRVSGAGGDPASINSIIATAHSGNDPKGISIQLIETGSSSDTFTGMLALGVYTSLDSGRLGVSGGDLITIKIHSKKGILSKTLMTRKKTGPLLTVDLGGGLNIEMVRIPAGKFVMGKVGIASPTHEVTISKDFYMSKYEITQGQWLKVMGALASADKPLVSQSNTYNYGKGENYPVYWVSWNDICDNGGNDFMTRLNAMGIVEGTFRLPTEAEWEYACRAGTKSSYYWGEDASESTMKQYCWYNKNASSTYWTNPHAAVQGMQIVGQKLPNAFGLFDMSGSANELCNDWYGLYTSAAVTDPAGPASGSGRLIRGGVWGGDSSDCRSASRNNVSPTHRNMYVGFRLALSPGQ